MTTGVLYDANNVAVGNATCWYKPWTATPSVPVADATAVFTTTAWETASWVNMGGTDEGFKVNVETSLTELMIEEQSTPVAQSVESRGITIEAALAEDTIENIKLAWNGGTIAVGAGPPAKKTITLTDTINYWTIVLEMRNWMGFARRIYIPKTTINASGTTAFRRAADKRLYPLRITSICAPSQIQIVEFSA